MWGRILISLSLVAAEVASSEETKSRLVNIIQGSVRGYKDPNEDITVFYNIPYAKAPTGEEKFKAPLPAPTWSETLEAVDRSIICPQLTSPHVNQSEKSVQEDCLVANVYVPNTEETELSVIVYIHGGGFILGYGDMVTPKKLTASKRVIAVTFNYRLGVHGFLCMGTQDIPGNAGMKDQVALLRWVQQNIKSFGGNNQDVTISGFSAGASSVGLLMISKMAQGLFHKAIPESGDILGPYSWQVNPIENAKEYALLINLDNVQDVRALELLYKNISYKTLLSGNLLERPDSTYLFAPCVEKDIGSERFIDDNPVTIIQRGAFKNIPVLVGFTNMEGLMRIDIFDQWREEMNANFSRFLPDDLYFNTTEQRHEVVHKIKHFYFKDEPVSTNNVLDYINFLSDVVFTCPTLRTIKLLLFHGSDNIYLYQYSYVDENTPKIPYTNVLGAGHCAQSNIILDEITFDSTSGNASEPSEKWRALMRSTWLNFITKGRPENPKLPEWKPLRVESFKYMELNENPEIKESLLNNRCSFWNHIYDEHYEAPLPPTF